MSLPGVYIDPHPPASFAVAIASNVAAPIYCVISTAGRYEPVWKLDSGFAWTCPCSGSRAGASELKNSFIEKVIGVFYNGTALTQQTRTALQGGAPGWTVIYNEDTGTGNVYICTPTTASPMVRGNTVMVQLQFTFSQVPTDVLYGSSSVAWKPWLVSVPSIGSKVAPNFNSPTQIAAGDFTFQNETHFFDSRVKLNWDFGTTSVWMGFSGFAWASFQQLGTWQNSSAILKDNVFTLKTKDPKVLVDTLFPSALYDQVTYPNIDTGAIGNPLQVAYGDNFGCNPVCIDTINNVFKVAGHAIYSFNAVRVKSASTGLYVAKNFASTSPSTGQFTLAPGDFAFGQDVSVDFTGKSVTNPSNGLSYPIKNPVDQVQDLLYQIGAVASAPTFAMVSNPTAGGWSSAARLWLDYGKQNTSFYADGTQQRAVLRSCSIYIDSQASMLSVLTEVLRDCRCYLTMDITGAFLMVPFRNYQGSTLPLVTDNNCLMPGIVVDGSGTPNFLVQAGVKPTQVQVDYGYRQQDGYNQVTLLKSAHNANLRNIPLTQQIPVEIQTLLSQNADAAYLANALLNEFRVDPFTYTFSVKWLAFNWLAGLQHIHLVSARHNIDVICEVLTISLNLAQSMVKVTVGNLRGFEESSGFWVNTADTTPSGATLAWPQQGETLTPYETQYRRHQAGHWHGSDDLAVDSTNGANKWDWQDYSTSRWQ